jgi:hypothetical protein
MMAEKIDSSGVAAVSASNDGKIIGGFRAADWLRRWTVNGNSIELMPDDKLWMFYAVDDPDIGGGWPVRDRLEAQLVRERAMPAIKALMARAGVTRMGIAA